MLFFFQTPLLYLIMLITAVSTHVIQVVSHIPRYPIAEIDVSKIEKPIRETTSAAPFIIALSNISVKDRKENSPDRSAGSGYRVPGGKRKTVGTNN